MQFIVEATIIGAMSPSNIHEKSPFVDNTVNIHFLNFVRNALTLYAFMSRLKRFNIGILRLPTFMTYIVGLCIVKISIIGLLPNRKLSYINVMHKIPIKPFIYNL